MLRKLLCVVGFALLGCLPAHSQQNTFGITPCNNCTQPMALTTSSSSITLDSKFGSTVIITNTGSNTAYITNTATATTTGFPIPAGYAIVFNLNPGSVISGITSTSTTSLVVAKGNGPTAIAGGGSGGGGGGGGAVTMASGAVASGAYSSGAFASGAYSSGSIAAGAMVDLLTVIGSKNAGTASTNSLTAGGVYNSTPLTLTNTQQASHQLDANGYLKVNVAAGGAGGGAVYGPTAVASPAANPPVLMGGTATGGATGNVAVATVRAGNTATTTDPSVVVADPNLLAAVNSSIPAGTNLIGDVNVRQGGTALSASNGIYANCLLGNAACATGTGAVGATSQRVAVAVDSATVAGSASLPAGTNAIGNTGTAPRAAQLSTAVVNFSSSGDNTIVTRVTGTIKVYQLSYVCASAVTQTVKNGTGTALSGAMPNVTTTFLPYMSGEPYYTTTSTNNFVINNGTAVSCQGTVWYLDN